MRVQRPHPGTEATPLSLVLTGTKKHGGRQTYSTVFLSFYLSFLSPYPFHPLRVRHLILVDPWGFKPVPPEGVASLGCPRWVEIIIAMASFFNPLAVVRATGPWGRRQCGVREDGRGVKSQTELDSV